MTTKILFVMLIWITVYVQLKSETEIQALLSTYPFVRPRDTLEYFYRGDDVLYDQPYIDEYKLGHQTFYTYPRDSLYEKLQSPSTVLDDVLNSGSYAYHAYVTKRKHKSRTKLIYRGQGREPSYVSRFQRNSFPYSNVVRLSTGCTGTLLTPYHVITAAHCVHNGNRYKRNIDMLKVEVPEMIGSRLYYVLEIKIPTKWKKSQTLPEVARGAYDYAVLKLNLPVRGRQKFIRLGKPEMSSLNSDLNLVSAGSKRFHGLTESTCHPDENLIVMKGNVLLTSCGVTGRGSSGSGVFENNGREGIKLIGILSNTVVTTSGNKEFEAIMLLTNRKCVDICNMINPEGLYYNVCKDIGSSQVRRYAERHRDMPIFGK